MCFLIKKIFLLALLSLVYSREICYDGYGCFKDTTPFGGTLQRPFAFLPDTPQRVNTRFFLYKRELKTYDEMSRLKISSYYDSSLPTKFIIHGFLENGYKQWMKDMASAILDVENTNVFLVDWSGGNGFPYTQATANTQIVGIEIALLISTLISTKQSKAKDFHLIGHSLGSHISGYAGKRIQGLGRITGLDPAGPYFENTDAVVRLDSNDALFVDNIHSDGEANLKLGLGLLQAIGHVDFYPNGGKNQPNCPTTSSKLVSGIFSLATLSVDTMTETTACSHMSAVYFFADSIKNYCKYTGYSCASYDSFNKGDCLKCSSNGCNNMGYWASKAKDLGSLYLHTKPTPPSNKAPFCKQSYRVNLKSNSLTSMLQTRGTFGLSLKSSQKSTEEIIVENSENTFKKADEIIRMVSFETPIENTIDTIIVSFKKTTVIVSGWLYDNQWSFSIIELVSGDQQTTTRFCPILSFITSGSTGEFKKC